MKRNNIRPTDLGSAGKSLWHAVVSTYDLAPHELEMLAQACRTSDVIAALDDAITEAVLSSDDSRVVPAVVELRLQRLALARLITALRLPDVDSGARPQHRGIRGVYALRRNA